MKPGRDTGNLFANLPVGRQAAEIFESLLETDGLKLKIERIISTGQATPPGEWFDQERDEWVVLLSGGAGLLFEGEAAPRIMRPGDWVLIPARRRHRVEWTDADAATVWLAVHFATKDK